MGIAAPSFTAKLLEDPYLTPEKEFDIKWSAGSLYSGGSDTVSRFFPVPHSRPRGSGVTADPVLDQTVSAIYAFFKAMVLYPEVAVKAQAEIDSVVGPDRLPTFTDRIDLPYLNALVLEVCRWHSVAPTGKFFRTGKNLEC